MFGCYMAKILRLFKTDTSKFYRSQNRITFFLDVNIYSKYVRLVAMKIKSNNFNLA